MLPLLFAIGCLNMLILWGTPVPDNNGSFPPVWFFYVMPIGFLLFSLWLAWGLKWVAIDAPNKRLYVSNYRKEIAIPFSEIVDVTEFILSDPRRITIHLRTETEFGKKIVFLGTYRFGGWLAGSHPIVKELKELSN
jgi:hypothetical protein